MEIDGHPTQDLLDELRRRGAVPVAGSSTGPLPDALRFVTERVGDSPGSWLFVPNEAFLTGLDEVPR